MATGFQKNPTLLAQFGLMPRYRSHGRPASKLDRGATLQDTDCEEEFIWFRGGATVINDPREGDQNIRSSIINNAGSETRRGVSSRRARRPICHQCVRSISPTALLHAGQGDDENG